MVSEVAGQGARPALRWTAVIGGLGGLEEGHYAAYIKFMTDEDVVVFNGMKEVVSDHLGYIMLEALMYALNHMMEFGTLAIFHLSYMLLKNRDDTLVVSYMLLKNNDVFYATLDMIQPLICCLQVFNALDMNINFGLLVTLGYQSNIVADVYKYLLHLIWFFVDCMQNRNLIAVGLYIWFLYICFKFLLNVLVYGIVILD
ncbi:hypothetical protein ACJX0J_027619, partial [Zea mays]